MPNYLVDRYTGAVLPVQVVHADYAAWDPEIPCSVCGGRYSCSIEDPNNPGLGVEIDPFIHAERETDTACSCCGEDEDCPLCEGRGVVP